MPDINNGPALELGFSLQPAPDGGLFIGIHWNVPMMTSVIAVPLDWAERLLDNFPRELAAILDQAKQQKTGLVVAPASTLNTLKGTN